MAKNPSLSLPLNLEVSVANDLMDGDCQCAASTRLPSVQLPRQYIFPSHFHHSVNPLKPVLSVGYNICGLSVVHMLLLNNQVIFVISGESVCDVVIISCNQ